MEQLFNNLAFGKHLESLRKEAELSIFELAAESDIEQGVIEQLEAGQKSPDLNLLHRLADTLIVSVEFLLGLSPSPKQMGKSNNQQELSQNINALEMVLANDTGWHARGFMAPTEMEKQQLRDGLQFRFGPPRELIHFYWESVPYLLTRIRALRLLDRTDLSSSL